MSDEIIRIDDHSQEFLNKVDEALGRAMEGIGVHLEGEAKDLITTRFYSHKTDPHKTGQSSRAYIDTGLLRNSIVYAVDGESASQQRTYADEGGGYVTYDGVAPKDPKGHSVMIGTNVPYAIYIHEGTSKIKPNRFLKDAVEMNKDQISEYIRKELKGVE